MSPSRARRRGRTAASRPTTGCSVSQATINSTRPSRVRPAGTANAYAPFDPAPGQGQSANWKRFVHAAVKRYGDRVRTGGSGTSRPSSTSGRNTPSPTIATTGSGSSYQGDQAGARGGARRQPVGADSSAPTTIYPTSIQHMLHLERDGRAECGVPPAGRLFDRDSRCTRNNIPAGGGVLNTIQATLNDHFRREVWLTETNGGDGLQNALRHFERRGWISKVFIGSMRSPDGCGALNLLDASKLPCPAYTALQAYIAAHPPAMHVAGTTAVAGHNDFVLLMNPHGHATGATVHYPPRHATRTRTYDLPATSRTTLYVPSEGFGGVEQGVSVVPARTDLPIWIEHADYWNGNKAGRLSQGTGERSDTLGLRRGRRRRHLLETRQHRLQPECDRSRPRHMAVHERQRHPGRRDPRDCATRLASGPRQRCGRHRRRARDAGARRVGRGWPAGADCRRADHHLGKRHRGPLDPRRAVPVADVGVRRGQPGRAVVDVPAADEPVQTGPRPSRSATCRRPG